MSVTYTTADGRSLTHWMRPWPHPHGKTSQIFKTSQIHFHCATMGTPTGWTLLINKVYVERQKTRNSYHNAEINFETKVGELTLPNFKTYNKAIVMKTVWYWQKNKYINGTKQISQKQAHINTVNWPWTGSKSNTMEQGKSFQQVVLEQIDIHMQKKKKNQSKHRSYILHNYLKTDYRPT